MTHKCEKHENRSDKFDRLEKTINLQIWFWLMTTAGRELKDAVVSAALNQHFSPTFPEMKNDWEEKFNGYAKAMAKIILLADLAKQMYFVKMKDEELGIQVQDEYDSLLEHCLDASEKLNEESKKDLINSIFGCHE